MKIPPNQYPDSSNYIYNFLLATEELLNDKTYKNVLVWFIPQASGICVLAHDKDVILQG